MYTYDGLLKEIGVYPNLNNKKKIKSIVHALVQNGKAIIENQLIFLDLEEFKQLYSKISVLDSVFDYSYNTKIELTKFASYVLNQKITLNPIFCPGYTSDGYKEYIGRNNTSRIEMLSSLKEKLSDMNISANFRITLADIFLESIDDTKNPNWYEELLVHTDKFFELVSKYFDEDEIIKLSEVYSDSSYIKGFIDDSLCTGKVYNNFYKNNLNFYTKMGWNSQEIKYRNDKLFTIYNLISCYINEQENGVYLPMETMYSRSKVMTDNDVCTLYLVKSKVG